MVGSPPQTVDQRKVNDKMAGHSVSRKPCTPPHRGANSGVALVSDDRPTVAPAKRIRGTAGVGGAGQEEEIGLRDMVTRRFCSLFLTHIQFRKIQENTL